ncbi:hypothetical protein HBI25_147100 [Parastagonospora nodorum]|nr:hypothetical protein HBI25_147100 [Parastagonospora nodorum]
MCSFILAPRGGGLHIYLKPRLPPLLFSNQNYPIMDADMVAMSTESSYGCKCARFPSKTLAVSSIIMINSLTSAAFSSNSTVINRNIASPTSTTLATISALMTSVVIIQLSPFTAGMKSATRIMTTIRVICYIVHHLIIWLCIFQKSSTQSRTASKNVPTLRFAAKATTILPENQMLLSHDVETPPYYL